VLRDLAANKLPPVQPFHAMAYPFSASLALAISAKYAEFCAITASRLALPPFAHPPAVPLAPGQRLRIGYVSSDFGNHPLSHLMGSVFGGHDRSKVGLSVCFPLPRFPHSLRDAVRGCFLRKDFGNHPRSHLMGSVVGGHDHSKVGLSVCLVYGFPY